VAAPSETLFQAVRRHLGNGWHILTERGVVSLYGAALLELAKLIDGPRGPFIQTRQLSSEGQRLIRQYGLKGTVGGVLRSTGAYYFPPLGRSRNPVNKALLEQAVDYHYTYELTKRDGVVPSRRPVNENDFALEIPFAFDVPAGPNRSIAVVIHCFYPEVLPLLLRKLESIASSFDLFLSTDTDAKKAEIGGHLENWTRGKTEIRMLPNRGRDIAAKFVGFHDVYQHYELFLHLHTKKSPHGGLPLEKWCDYLVDNLIGSPEIVRSILSLFDDDRLGIVFSQHLFEIRGILNWGYNYDHARELMAKLGVSLNKNLILEFPSGSMFWGRCAAIRPLLEAGFDYPDFLPEGSHVDGTLAHAIERCVLMAAESRGFEWLKVVQRPLYPLTETVLKVSAPSDLEEHRLRVFRPCLTPVDALVPPFFESLRETAPIQTYPSRNKRPRLNLLINTINKGQAFGGVATAIKCFKEWADALGDGFDRRIVVADAEIEPDAYASFPDFVALPFLPSVDREQRVLIDASLRDGGAIDLRETDFFIATAWWTATMAIEFDDARERNFQRSLPFVYLIQDDEPYFYGSGSKSALAEATYHYQDRTIAVINSEELYAKMTSKCEFLKAFCIPYRLNETISNLLKPQPRERIILFYARPFVARNAFELICAGLCSWQRSDPIRASRWKIKLLGEAFDQGHIYPLQNAEVEGKISLERYADYLCRASVGVSLMLSPHPSYPPLEMAEAGLKVVTNGFGDKNLRFRFPSIISVDKISVDSIAVAIERAVSEADGAIGEIIPRQCGSNPGALGPTAESDVIARTIHAALVGAAICSA
jgi:hypothetical protein